MARQPFMCRHTHSGTAVKNKHSENHVSHFKPSGAAPASQTHQVSLLILIEGNFDEKSFALAAILIATCRATAL